jgi:uncharacterized protein with PCYCGC motif
LVRSRAALAIGISVALIVACAPQPAARPSAPAASAGSAAQGMVVTALTLHAAMGVYPAAYRSLTGEIRAAYDYALANRDTLQWMPCYCGCASPGHGRNGHKNNYDCYVLESMADGSVTLDLHATTCYTCVGITNDVASMVRSGMTDLLSIRRAIDSKWSKYGPSTPTKLPPA